MERLLKRLFGARPVKPQKTAPQATEEQRKAARKAALEYANFLGYDGSEQAPIDANLL